MRRFPTLVPCVDEKSQMQVIERTQPVLQMGLGKISQSYARVLRGMAHRGAISPGRVDRASPRDPIGCAPARSPTCWPALRPLRRRPTTAGLRTRRAALPPAAPPPPQRQRHHVVHDRRRRQQSLALAALAGVRQHLLDQRAGAHARQHARTDQMRYVNLRRQRLASSRHRFRPSKPRWSPIVHEKLLSEQYFS